MAVLFADVADSKGLCRKLGETAAREVIASGLRAVGALATAREGRVVKTVDDAVACVFPEAEAALRTSVEMQAASRSTRFGGEPLQFHIGLHFGPVYLQEREVFGDTLNGAAYLAATARGDAILATQAFFGRLSAPSRQSLRPIFRSVLKGSGEASTVYQACGDDADVDATTVNLHAGKLVPTDTGSLLLTYGDAEKRIDHTHPSITLGRNADCDIVVPDMFASRQHATIKLRRMRFYLLDHSTNGTFVWMRGEELHVLRAELLLGDEGEISLGRRRSADGEGSVRFRRDRRAMYRV